MEDQFPAGAQVMSTPGEGGQEWVSVLEGPVSSGERALKIRGKGLAQNFYHKGAAPIEVPGDGRFAFMVFLDPVEVPQAVMIQFYSEGKWRHRAVWGDSEVIPFGVSGTTSRFAAGDLPPEGNWARLEIDAEKIGLKAGDQITGIALTLAGGTAYFDQLSMVWRVDAAKDPNQSFQAWLGLWEGKEAQGVPLEVSRILKKAAGQRSEAEREQLWEYYLSQVCLLTKPILEPLRTAWMKFRAEREALEGAIPASLILRDTPMPRESFVMQRGEYNQPGEKVLPGVPSVLPPLGGAQKPNRLDFARWLVSDSHPLTSRVAVNRFWQQFFGVGLVKSSDDFGSQGQPPSHPELLDWLAVTFRESGWDVQKLVRLMVTSAAFRQSSSAAPEQWRLDPENRWLARGPRFRLDAEELRDMALTVSGLLNPKIGGRGVRPYQPPNIWEPVAFVGSNTRSYRADTGPELYRRSLYTFLKRTAPPPLMANFDAPSREQSCTRRERSNTPMQALQLMNDVQFLEAARVLAERLCLEGGATPADRIAYGFRAVLGRAPAAQELEVVSAAYEQHLGTYRRSPETACRLVTQGESRLRRGIPIPELAAWTLVAHLLLNLDEAISQH